jgi:hypothetical protein
LFTSHCLMHAPYVYWMQLIFEDTSVHNAWSVNFVQTCFALLSYLLFRCTTFFFWTNFCCANWALLSDDRWSRYIWVTYPTIIDLLCNSNCSIQLDSNLGNMRAHICSCSTSYGILAFDDDQYLWKHNDAVFLCQDENDIRAYLLLYEPYYTLKNMSWVSFSLPQQSAWIFTQPQGPWRSRLLAMTSIMSVLKLRLLP